MTEEPKVSVAVLNETELKFELKGKFKCSYLPKEASGIFEVKLENNIIKLSTDNDEFIINDGVIFEPLDFDEQSFLLKDVVIGIKFHWQKKEDQEFKGSLKILKEKNKLTAVNILPVEDYLTSVISSEMSATSSEELLKAHSIISRSWLIAQIEKRSELKKRGNFLPELIENDEKLIKWFDREDHELYDVCADDHCQRYQGITKIIDEKSKKAIEFTRGRLLMFNDKICDARYSKSCGGVSEHFENVWENTEHPYLTTVVDNKENTGFKYDLTKEPDADKWIKGNPPAFCNTTDRNILSQVLVDFDQSTKDFYRWKVEYTQNEISTLINKNLKTDFGKIIDLIPVKRGVSGRLIELKIVGTKKSLIIGKELIIRKTLSTSHLYSSAFIIEKQNVNDNIPEKFILIGAGWGHGVGLCQIGAAVMGAQGFKYDEILLHYFTGAEIKKLYN